MTANMKGEVTASTILEQCQRMSNDNIWAFFDFNPHLDEKNRVLVRVKPADLESDDIYSSWDNFDKPLAEIMQDLIGIEYQYQEQQSAKDAK